MKNKKMRQSTYTFLARNLDAKEKRTRRSRNTFFLILVFEVENLEYVSIVEDR